MSKNTKLNLGSTTNAPDTVPRSSKSNVTDALFCSSILPKLLSLLHPLLLPSLSFTKKAGLPDATLITRSMLSPLYVVIPWYLSSSVPESGPTPPRLFCVGPLLVVHEPWKSRYDNGVGQVGVGAMLGELLGALEATLLGASDGALLGAFDGALDGELDGAVLGALLGAVVGQAPVSS